MSDSSDDDESPGYDIDPEQRDEAILCLVKLHSILAIGREQHDIKLAQERSLLDQSYDDSGIATGDNSVITETGQATLQQPDLPTNHQYDQLQENTTMDNLVEDFEIIENTQFDPNAPGDILDDDYDISSLIDDELEHAIQNKMHITPPQHEQQTFEEDEFTGIFNREFYDSIRRTNHKQRPTIPAALIQHDQAQIETNEERPFSRVIERMNVRHVMSENDVTRPNTVTEVTESRVITCVNCEGPVELDPNIGFAYCSPCGYAFCTSCGNAYHGVQDCHQTTRPVLNPNSIVRELEARFESMRSYPRPPEERERVERELIDNERAIREQERRERNRMERERQEREVRERESSERDRIERDRIERERAVREEEIRERDRLERERQLMENERLERERREREARELESKRRREQKRKDDKASEQLIRNSCKKCPGCKNYIEQDTRGCNHMTCSRCKMEFCWLCMHKIKSQSDLERHYTRCTLFEYTVD